MSHSPDAAQLAQLAELDNKSFVPRTLGYLKPGTGFDLAAKVGRVVGVEGTTLLDQSLRLNVVTPTRVDVLTPEETDADTPEAPPTDKPADKPAGDG